jgi:hypothetical protein
MPYYLVVNNLVWSIALQDKIDYRQCVHDIQTSQRRLRVSFADRDKP